MHSLKSHFVNCYKNVCFSFLSPPGCDRLFDYLPIALETRGTGSQSQMSAFDENTVNMYQFVQMTETFVGDNPALEVFQALCRYMRGGYVETEEEKLTRLTRVKLRNNVNCYYYYLYFYYCTYYYFLL